MKKVLYWEDLSAELQNLITEKTAEVNTLVLPDYPSVYRMKFFDGIYSTEPALKNSQPLRLKDIIYIRQKTPRGNARYVFSHIE